MRLFAIFALAAVTCGLEVPESELANGVQPLDDEAMVEVECQGEECNVNDDDNSLVEEEADEERRFRRNGSGFGYARRRQQARRKRRVWIPSVPRYKYRR